LSTISGHAPGNDYCNPSAFDPFGDRARKLEWNEIIARHAAKERLIT
jgi:hypothetical protein